MTTDVRQIALRAGGHRGSRGRGFWSRLGLALRVWDERRRLARVDEHMLRDLGLSRADVAREADRPFWDLPVNR